MKTFREEWNVIKERFFSEKYQNQLKDSINRLSEKPFVLYGAGAEGVEFANVLKYVNCPPLCFCDKYKTGTEPDTDIAIISPSQLLDEYKETNIVITSNLYREEIEKELTETGISENRILPRYLLLAPLLQLCNEGDMVYSKYLKRRHYIAIFNNFNEMLTGKNDKVLKYCEKTYEWLSDDKSKEVFMNYIKLYLLSEPVTPDPIKSQYFDPVMNYSDNEVFTDCGAYIGDTALLFMNKINDRYSHYFAFEPDSNNRKKAIESLKDKPNVDIIPKGLWSCEKTLHFSDGKEGSSAVTEDGDVSVEVTSIDKYFSDKEQIPTIIKMDIEGSELEALKGAQNTIRNHKPKLAICVYHKPEDLYEIPQFIKSCRDDYKFYVRHYTDTFAELVLYAI